jgi:hypothetical protein
MVLQRNKYLHNLLARHFVPEHIDDYPFDNPILVERKYHAERRNKMIACLPEVAAEATAALNDAGLSMPLFFSVPSSGEALATFATPGDPSEEDWRRVSDIIIKIVGSKLGIEGLRTSALPCVASCVHMGAADIIPASADHRPETGPNR